MMNVKDVRNHFIDELKNERFTIDKTGQKTIEMIGASKKALERAKLTINDIDIVELNEAFASQSLACIKDLEID